MRRANYYVAVHHEAASKILVQSGFAAKYSAGGRL
jgi:hypothetical protein